MQTVIDHLNKLSRDYTRRHGAFLCSTLKWHSCLRRPVSGRCKDHEDPAVGEGAAQPCDAANRQQVRAGPTAVAGAGVGLRGVAQQPPLQDGAAAFDAELKAVLVYKGVAVDPKYKGVAVDPKLKKGELTALLARELRGSDCSNYSASFVADPSAEVEPTAADFIDSSDDAASDCGSHSSEWPHSEADDR